MFEKSERKEPKEDKAEVPKAPKKVKVYRKDLGVKSILESEQALYLKSGWVLTSSRESLKDE